MDTLILLGSTLGLSFLAGINLYATVLMVGAGIRFDWIHLNPELHQLGILADYKILAVAGIFYFLEFFADKIPWIDSFWDLIHTFVRPLGAASIAAAASVGTMDPTLRVIFALFAGTVTLASHTSKASIRAAVNLSPEPFSNIAISLFEDGFVAAACFFIFIHPIISALVVTVILLGCAIIIPKLIRKVLHYWAKTLVFLKNLFKYDVEVMESWYFHESGQTYGPCSDSQIKHLISHGRINRDTHLCKAGDSNWIKSFETKFFS